MAWTKQHRSKDQINPKEKASRKMKITLKRSCTVKPAEPTFQGCLPLSLWDQIGYVTHTPGLYFYRPGQQWLKSPDSIFRCLESSLSKVLVHFYPLAGRLRSLGGGRLEVDCNAAGVELVEVESDATLADLGDLSPSPEFRHLFPCIDYKNTPLVELPLLYVQLTKFQCGGICLSITVSHAVVDGLSTMHFVSEWTRIARGETLGTKPIFDRKVFQNGRDYSQSQTPQQFQHDQYFQLTPVLIGESSNESERKKKTSTAVLKLTKHQVETLKKKANASMKISSYYTRYEVIAAHTWRSACKARNLVKEQPTSLGLCVDIRDRLQPSLPKGYFGNAIVDVVASGYSGELLSQPLSYAASKIRAAVSQVTNEYIHSATEYMENQKDISRFQDLYQVKKHSEGSFYGNPNLVVISWLTLPLYNRDFGWGKEVSTILATHEGDGDCVILPGKEKDGSLALAFCLQDSHFDAFREFFYADVKEGGSAAVLGGDETITHCDQNNSSSQSIKSVFVRSRTNSKL